jgi:hypothetical protein
MPSSFSASAKVRPLSLPSIWSMLSIMTPLSRIE